MKLRCLAGYENRPRGLQFEPGVIEVETVTATFLLNDAPGTFEIVSDEPQTREVAAPARTTAIKRAPRTKTFNSSDAADTND